VNILFLSVSNSARSQIAEGLARAILGDAAKVLSAGSEPSGRVHPLAVKTLAEIGIDISTHHPKSVADLRPEFVGALDFVITLSGENSGPSISASARHLHWPMPDPAAASEAESLLTFRHVCDEIEKRIEYFWEFQKLDQEALNRR